MNSYESVPDYRAEREPYRWSRAEYERMAEPALEAISVDLPTDLLAISPACCVAPRVASCDDAPLGAPCRQTKIRRNLV